jgi:DUF177 domain-containing protein
MRLDLSKIRTAHERYEKVYPADAFAVPFRDDRDTFQVVDPVSLAFDIDKEQQQFRLVGSVQTMLQLPCSRCLESFTLPVDARFDLRYQPHTANRGEGEREIEEDDLTTAFYDNDEIDLAQLMREQFYLALPMKPLCQPECRGLCPVCGTNLNRNTCACKSGWADPRFAALKALQGHHHDRQS